MVKRGHQASIIGLYPEPYVSVDENDAGVRVVRVPNRGLPILRFLSNAGRFHAALCRLNEQRPIDIVEGGEIDLYYLKRSSPGIKVLRMHGGPTFFHTGSRIQVWKERRSFRVADRICAVSHAVGEGTREMLGLGSVPIEVIHNPIDTGEYAPDSSAERDGLILFAGTVTPRKGICELIRAMPLILAKVPNARLEVYGGEAIDPPPSSSLTKTLIASMPPEVASRVEWKGRVPRNVLPAALKRASVCVYPSHIEAMPIAWIEALASGKAVVAAKTGPGPEIIDDGVTGLLCDPRDPVSIAEQIVRVLTDANLRARLGAAARRSAVERYALEKIVDRNIEFYDSLVAAPRLSLTSR
jgi:glycosyltransferase involved in cell wall biosynthesis